MGARPISNTYGRRGRFRCPGFAGLLEEENIPRLSRRSNPYRSPFRSAGKPKSRTTCSRCGWWKAPIANQEPLCNLVTPPRIDTLADEREILS
jgi:hypothetical protein